MMQAEVEAEVQRVKKHFLRCSMQGNLFLTFYDSGLFTKELGLVNFAKALKTGLLQAFSKLDY